jgi:membrane protease YdiL (CAAX protease family)
MTPKAAPAGREQPERSESAGREMRLGYALLWVVGAAFSAQLAGNFVAGFCRSLLAKSGALPAQLEHAPAVIIPALAASGLALLTVTLYAPQVAGVPVSRALNLRPAPPNAYVLAVVGTVALGPTGDWLMRLAAELYPDATLGVVPMLNDLVRAMPLFIVWPAFALLPGVSEELAFRGLLQSASGPARLRVALSAVLFALFHVDPHHVVGVLPLGLFFAWVASRYGTLVTIGAHVANNTIAITMARAGQDSEQVIPFSWVAASWLVVLACVVALARGQAQGAAGDGADGAVNHVASRW